MRAQPPSPRHYLAHHNLGTHQSQVPLALQTEQEVLVQALVLALVSVRVQPLGEPVQLGQGQGLESAQAHRRLLCALWTQLLAL